MYWGVQVKDVSDILEQVLKEPIILIGEARQTPHETTGTLPGNI